jgi:hypothetical protein
MSLVKVLSENYVDSASLSTYSKSSEQSSFPATNTFAGKRRSKVWRSNGYWNITGGSNTIIFQETSGVNLTATVAAAEYTSTTSFLAAIKTAFQAVGGSVYTVTKDATSQKITIASNGAGGGNILKLMWTNASSAAMAGILGYSTSADDTGALTYAADLIRNCTSEWIKWDFGTSANPKAFVLLGDRASAIKISPLATVTLQGNITDTWTSPVYSQTVAYDERAMTLFSTTGLHTSALRYWRLLISDLDNPLGYVEVSAIYLGDAYATTQGAPQFPFKTKKVDYSTSVTAEGGQLLVDAKAKTQRFSLDWKGLSVTEIEHFDALFESVGTAIPFLMAFDSGSAFSSSAGVYTRMVRYTDAPDYSLESPNNWSMSMELQEDL